MANMQAISDACSEKKAELRSLERNVTALSSTTQALHGWIKKNEAKVASLPENVSPSDVIVPVDDLSEAAIAAQVHINALLQLFALSCMYRVIMTCDTLLGVAKNFTMQSFHSYILKPSSVLLVLK